MGRFFIETFGCKTNIADSMAIRARLAREGHEPAEVIEHADLVVVNTCSVTSRADSDARRLVQRISRSGNRRVIVTGCLAERAPEEVASWQGVDTVVPNRRKAQLLPMMREDAVGVEAADEAVDLADGTLWDAPTDYPFFRDSGYTRAFVKIQDGCDAVCSFCIIPVTRGASRSLARDRVVASVRSLGESGAKEVVLTGIHLGHYGRDRGESLRELLDDLRRLPRPARLRVTSIEPNEIREDLVRVIADSDRFARHMHLPMQSGSDRVLARMRRPYNSAQYGKAVELVARSFDTVGIGADVIVGFPGETDGDFQQTVDLIRSLPLTYLHVFSYSSRAGTEAADLGGAVDSKTVKERSRVLRDLSDSLRRTFIESRLGRTESALTLGEGPLGVNGLTGTFIKVRMPAGVPLNELIEVRVDGISGDTALVTPCDSALRSGEREETACPA